LQAVFSYGITSLQVRDIPRRKYQLLLLP